MDMSPHRDDRIDAIRGLSLMMIFSSHLAYLGNNTVLRDWALPSLTFCDSANIFVFISGFMAGRVYGRRLLRDGAAAMRRRAFARARELYRWHLGTLVVTVAAVTLISMWGPGLVDEARLAPIFMQPVGTTLAASGMLYTPYAFDVLRLYVIVLLLLPFWLPLLHRKPWLAVGLSVCVYAIPQFVSGAAIPDWPGDRVWYFNPLAWQLQFFLGVALGHHGLPGSRRFLRSNSLAIFAGLVLAVGIFVKTTAPAMMAAYNPSVPFIHDDLVYGKLPLTGKTNLEPLRLITFAALVLLTTRFLPGAWSGWRSRAMRPLVLCGRNALKVYCLGLFLTFTAGQILRGGFAGDGAMIGAVAAGIALQVAAAAILERRRTPSVSSAVTTVGCSAQNKSRTNTVSSTSA